MGGLNPCGLLPRTCSSLTEQHFRTFEELKEGVDEWFLTKRRVSAMTKSELSTLIPSISVLFLICLIWLQIAPSLLSTHPSIRARLPVACACACDGPIWYTCPLLSAALVDGTPVGPAVVGTVAAVGTDMASCMGSALTAASIASPSSSMDCGGCGSSELAPLPFIATLPMLASMAPITSDEEAAVTDTVVAIGRCNCW